MCYGKTTWGFLFLSLKSLLSIRNQAYPLVMKISQYFLLLLTLRAVRKGKLNFIYLQMNPGSSGLSMQTQLEAQSLRCELKHPPWGNRVSLPLRNPGGSKGKSLGLPGVASVVMLMYLSRCECLVLGLLLPFCPVLDVCGSITGKDPGRFLFQTLKEYFFKKR